jgi:hypothetical protein
MKLLAKTAAGVAIFGAICAASAAEARSGLYRSAWHQPEYRFTGHSPAYGDSFYNGRGFYAAPSFSAGDIAGIQHFERMR